MLQAFWRGFAARKERAIMSAAAITVQSRWRAARQHRLYKATIRQIVHIQAAVRCHQARRRFLAARRGAILAQAIWRGRSARCFVSRSRAAIQIQAAFRGRSVRQRGAAQDHAARHIQAAWRGHQQHARYQHSRQCIILMQAYTRQYLARKRFIQLKAASSNIQSRWRALQAGRHQRQKLQLWHACATQIQARWRTVQHRGRFVHLKTCTVRIQAAQRCCMQRKQYLRRRTATLTIQAAYRALLLGRHTRQHIALQQHSACCIQACWRGSKQRKVYKQQRLSAITVQASWRCHRRRASFLRLKHAAVTIQSAYRALQAGRNTRQQMAQLRSATCTIQASWRRHLQHRCFLQQRRSAVVIQSTLRRHIAQTSFLQLKHACLKIQSAWAALKAGQAVRTKLNLQHQAATCIQAHWHGSKQRMLYKRAVQGLVKLQAAVRRHLAQGHYQRSRQSCLLIQSRYRALTAGRTARAQLQQQHKAATCIQARWRCHKRRRAFQHIRGQAVLLQTAVRRTLARKALRTLAAVVVLQSGWRARQARQLLQRLKVRTLVCTLYFGFSVSNTMRR